MFFQYIIVGTDETKHSKAPVPSWSQIIIGKLFVIEASNPFLINFIKMKKIFPLF